MDVQAGADDGASRIALAIGEPARARMLYHLMDERARTSTELAAAAEVSPSTASVHLNRLKAEGLVKVRAQGKHRYYTLAGSDVAEVLEALSVLAGGRGRKFEPHTPQRLRLARTCYDHLAGTLGVALHDRLRSSGCLLASTEESYELTRKGSELFASLGVDVGAMRALRRRFAFACLDWSERRSHLGGAAGAALLNIALKRRWVTQDLDSRALSVTGQGQRELLSRFGVELRACS
jgi:DNA-binding transcriptional ArsR family regulator